MTALPSANGANRLEQVNSNVPDRSATLVVAPSRGRYSQTFVRAHIERLGGRVEVLYGRGARLETSDGDLLVSGLWESAARAASVIGRASVVQRRARSQAISAFCIDRGIGVALAEFGLTAASISRDLERAGVPLVAHFHGYDAYDEETLTEWLPRYRNMFARGTEIVVVSEHMRRQLVSLGADAAAIHVIRVGVDIDRFKAAKPADAPPRFLAVGRFVHKKAPHRSIEAFGLAHATHPEARLTMVGDGPLLDSSIELAGSLGLSDVIDFVDPQSNEAVAELMRSSRALIQHSVRAPGGDREGTPVVVMEAMASGLPIISTDHTGIGEILEHERTGLLSAEHDVAAMAGHISRLIEDPALAARLGEAAAVDARANHSLTASIAALATLLEEVRARGPG